MRKKNLQLIVTGGSSGGAGQAVFAGDALICGRKHTTASAGASSSTDNTKSFRF